MGKVKVGHIIPYYCSLELLFSDKYLIGKYFPSTFKLGHGPSRCNHQDQDRGRVSTKTTSRGGASGRFSRPSCV